MSEPYEELPPELTPPDETVVEGPVVLHFGQASGPFQVVVFNAWATTPGVKLQISYDGTNWFDQGSCAPTEQNAANAWELRPIETAPGQWNTQYYRVVSCVP